MRTLTLLVAIVGVATTSGAQTPLTLDTTFEHFMTPEWIEQWGTGSFSVNDIALRSDGLLLTTGNRLRPPGGATGGGGGGVLLVNENGDYVESPFNSGSGGRITELPNGQYFYGYKRWNATGERDFSFGYPDLPFQGTSDFHVYPDRTVLVGGMFKIEEDGLIEYGLIKVDEWGEYDPNFTARKIGPGTSRIVDRIFPLNNGQFLISGSFTTYEGEFSGPIIRINPDGTRDPGFYFPSWKGEVYERYEQPDGKLILGGRFFMNDFPDTVKVVRVLPDGSLDETFNNRVDYRTGTFSASAMAAGVNVLVPLGDGRMVVGGMFTHVDGEPRGSIACIDTLGDLLDCWAGGGLIPEGYTPGGGPYFGLAGFKCLSNGDCYIFGEYKGFIDANGLQHRQCIMSRIFVPSTEVREFAVGQHMLEVWPNPAEDKLNVQLPAGIDNGTLKINDALGRTVLRGMINGSRSEIDVSNLALGTYFVEFATGSAGLWTAKWIKQ